MEQTWQESDAMLPAWQDDWWDSALNSASDEDRDKALLDRSGAFQATGTVEPRRVTQARLRYYWLLSLIAAEEELHATTMLDLRACLDDVAQRIPSSATCPAHAQDRSTTDREVILSPFRAREPAVLG